MRKLVLAAFAASVIASPAIANGQRRIVECVERIHINHDGKTYNLRHEKDFRLAVSPYGQVGVQLKKRIEVDPRWAHARPAATKCVQ